MLSVGNSPGTSWLWSEQGDWWQESHADFCCDRYCDKNSHTNLCRDIFWHIVFTPINIWRGQRVKPDSDVQYGAAIGYAIQLVLSQDAILAWLYICWEHECERISQQYFKLMKTYLMKGEKWNRDSKLIHIWRSDNSLILFYIYHISKDNLDHGLNSNIICIA